VLGLTGALRDATTAVRETVTGSPRAQAVSLAILVVVVLGAVTLYAATSPQPGLPSPPDPIAFRIPLPGDDWPVYWYGLMITLGALLGATLASREAARRGINPDHVWNALIVVLVTGLVGARLYHVLSSPAGSSINFAYYRDNPVEIVAFWKGGLRGLGIFGGLVGGLFGLWLYCLWADLSLREMADLAAPGVALGQAIGRWGNYFNQELYGFPTSLPWGIRIDPINRLSQFQDLPAEQLFHPSFLYESLWNLMVMFLLLYLARNWGDRMARGDLVLVYAAAYSLGRYFVELERPDAWRVGEIPVAQAIAIAVILISAVALLVRHGALQRLKAIRAGQSQPA
jgi:phosphatidylglycerol:prolipoprotein diacylglycerol transferase